MQTPPEIAFRGFEAPESLKVLVAREVDDLERFCPTLTTVRVIVDQPHRHKGTGRRFDVHIQLGVRGDELIVDREPGRDEKHEDPRLAVRQAFKAARRRLQDWLRQQRGFVKVHEEAPVGRIVRLFPADGYGFVRGPDGEEVYFHENAVVDGSFEKLEIGDRVSFVQEQGVNGPQASTVHVA